MHNAKKRIQKAEFGIKKSFLLKKQHICKSEGESQKKKKVRESS